MTHQQNEQLAEALSIFAPNQSVFIQNLPFCCDSRILFDFFSNELQLPIIRAYVNGNRANKKTLQCGFVLFQSTEDADRCIEYMNGKRFHGRDIK